MTHNDKSEILNATNQQKLIPEVKP